MSLNVSLGDTERHVVFHSQAGRIGPAYLIEGSETDAKDAVPHLEAMTGLTESWDFVRVTGSIKPGRAARGSRG